MNLQQVFWSDVQQPRGRVNEQYRFEPLDSDLACPSFRLTIEESWAESGRPLFRVTATTQVNHGARRHVAAHPLWSIDCRPFLLWQIYDAFWHVKLMAAGYGEPKTLTFSLRDQKRDAVTHVTITAEAFYDGGGEPIVALPNYANTHIYDLLAKIYRTNPAARPSPDWIDDTKGRILTNHAEEQAREKRHQEMLLRARPQDGEQRCLYIDESGDLGFKDHSHHYVATGVVIKNSLVEGARDKIRGIIAKHWRGAPPKELHFSKLPAAKLPAVTNDLADIVFEAVDEIVCFASANIDFLRYLLRCEAEHNRNEDHPIQTNIADLLADRDTTHPGRKLLMLITEELIGHVAVDCLISNSNIIITHDKKHREWMEEALRRGFERSKESVALVGEEIYGCRSCPQMEFHIIMSELEPCLWLSDWVSWEFGNWIRGGNLSDAFQKVRTKIKFLSFGDAGEKIAIDGPGGEIIGRFPDRPRAIATIS